MKSVEKDENSNGGLKIVVSPASEEVATSLECCSLMRCVQGVSGGMFCA